MHPILWVSQVAQWFSPGLEDLLEENMAAHSSILVWEIPWTEQPDGLQSLGSQRIKCYEQQQLINFGKKDHHTQII